VNHGPFGTPFEEPEGAFPLAKGYLAPFHIEVTEYLQVLSALL
jgi:hypothetical protein